MIYTEEHHTMTCDGADCSVTPKFGNRFCSACYRKAAYRGLDQNKTSAAHVTSKKVQLCTGRVGCEVTPKNGFMCSKCLKLREKGQDRTRGEQLKALTSQTASASTKTIAAAAAAKRQHERDILKLAESIVAYKLNH